MSAPLRFVRVGDDVLLPEGITRVLVEAGLEAVAQAVDADDLIRKLYAFSGHASDVAALLVR